MTEHDNDWTVSTLKQHFDALRGEDQKAISLLALDLKLRLDRMNESFDDLKISFERFHSTFAGQAKEGAKMGLIGYNTLMLIILLMGVGVDLFVRLR